MPSESTRAALSRTRDSAAVKSGQPFNTGASSSGEKGRITVDLGPDLYRQFKASAALQGRQMNEVVRELVTGWLLDHPLA